jgi:CHAD domain-containing protein
MSNFNGQGFELLACEHVGEHLGSLTSQFEGIRVNEDIEPVHKARVALRRLRVSLKIFSECFPSGKVKKWRRSLRKMRKQLGRARDLDVALCFLGSFIDQVPADDKSMVGLERIRLRMSQQREAVQGKLLEVLEAGPWLEALEEIEDYICSIHKGGIDPADYRTMAVFREGQFNITRRLRKVRKKEARLEAPSDARGHHKLRIALRNFRYTMEVFSGAYEPALDGYIKDVRKAQSMLGEIHDCDVWGEYLDKFVRKELSRTRQYFGSEVPFEEILPGVECLREDRLRLRRERFGDLKEYWQRLSERRIWEHLIKLLQDYSDQPVLQHREREE